MREVLTYARRGSRFTPRQQEAWDAHHQRWVIPDEAVDRPGFRWADWFGREAPLVVEIGSGIGEATAALAPTLPMALMALLAPLTRTAPEAPSRRAGGRRPQPRPR